jgi:ATP-dependent Clp protease adaptor protein ClpS
MVFSQLNWSVKFLRNKSPKRLQLLTINNIVINVLAGNGACKHNIKDLKMANIEVNSKIKPNVSLREPPLFKIVYLNDDVTSMDFVVTSLIEYFNYNPDTASAITVDIHEKGSAVVAVLPFEIAEQLGIEVTLEARALGFPLQVKVESESN